MTDRPSKKRLEDYIERWARRMRVDEVTDEVVRRALEWYKEDIKDRSPNFDRAVLSDARRCFEDAVEEYDELTRENPPNGY